MFVIQVRSSVLLGGSNTYSPVIPDTGPVTCLRPPPPFSPKDLLYRILVSGRETEYGGGSTSYQQVKDKLGVGYGTVPRVTVCVLSPEGPKFHLE